VPVLSHKYNFATRSDRNDVDPIAIFQNIIRGDLDASFRHAIISAQTDPSITMNYA
jgi:hypothetical protein